LRSTARASRRWRVDGQTNANGPETWEPYVRAVWDHDFDGTGRLVTASLLSITAPSYSLPAVLLGQDWASVIPGTRLKFAPNATAFAAFSSQIGQNNVTTYGGQIGVNIAFQPPAVVAKY
jgi:outer membrane lipase/esterase